MSVTSRGYKEKVKSQKSKTRSQSLLAPLNLSDFASEVSPKAEKKEKVKK